MMQAIQKVGAPFGVAILGSVLSSAYQAQLNLAGLPPAVANVVKESLFGGWQWLTSLARHRCSSRCAQPSSTGWTSRSW